MTAGEDLFGGDEHVSPAGVPRPVHLECTGPKGRVRPSR